MVHNTTDADAVVISGMSGRFPDCSNISEFRDALYAGRSLVSSDESRWKDGTYGLHTYGGKLRDLERFDASFFAVNARQANCMDPQVRFLLELAHEAVVDAGYSPVELRETDTGVFVGMSNGDAWENAMDLDGAEEFTGYEIIGSAKCMVANRISYAMDLRGIGCVIDTACSSSATALQQAVEAVSSGRCWAAIAGGTNVLFNPASSIQFNKLGMFSKECRSFDSEGRGYVRSEAAALFFIQRARDARRVYATVVGIKGNTDGYKIEGSTFPSSSAQLRLLRSIYTESGVDPDDVFYVEAHGTGTVAGDPAEGGALAAMFCEGTTRTRPLYVGSVKSNIGHTEAASGAVGLVKLLLAMEGGSIAANRNFVKPNPKVEALVDRRMEVVVENMRYDKGLMGLTNIGFGGVNVHLIISPNQKPKTQRDPHLDLLTIASGRTEAAVEAILKAANDHNDPEFTLLVNKIHETAIPRHPYRGYAYISPTDEKIEIKKTTDDEKRPLWFVYSGMGSQWQNMGKGLMHLEVFRDTIEKCGEVLKEFGIDLVKCVTTAGKEELDVLANCFPAIIAVEIALTEVLRSLGLEADGIVGHSLGEIGCGYCDGSLTLQEAILLAYARGKGSSDADLIPGLMAAIGLSWQECEDRCPPDVFPACNNAPNNVTISGPKGSVEHVITELWKDNIFTRCVETAGIAFHSQYIEPAAPTVLNLMRRFLPNPKRRSPKWISSSVPQISWTTDLAAYSSAEYHCNNFKSPVLFLEALQHVPADAVIVEVSPHCLLQSVLKRALKPSNTIVGLIDKRSGDVRRSFMCNIGRLYISGHNPKVNNLQQLFNFPVSRGTPNISSLIKWNHEDTFHVPLFKCREKFGVHLTYNLNDPDNAYLYDYVINGRSIFPPIGFIIVAWMALAKAKLREASTVRVELRGVEFLSELEVTSNMEMLEFCVEFLRSSNVFEVSCLDRVYCRGIIEETRKEINVEVNEQHYNSELTPEMFVEDVYKHFTCVGCNYGENFKTIYSYNGLQSKINANNIYGCFDSVIQTLMLVENRTSDDLLRLKGIKSLIFDTTAMKSEATVTINTKINSAITNGVIMFGVEFDVLQLTVSKPRMDYVCFFPDESTEITSENEVLLAAIQIASENCNNFLEVSAVSFNQKCWLPNIMELIKSERDLRACYTLVTNLELKIEDIRVTMNVDENSADFLVVSCLEGNINSEQFASILLKSGGFLLLEEVITDKMNLDPMSFKRIFRRFVDTKRVFSLYRHHPTTTEDFIIFKTTQNSLEKLQELIESTETNETRVIVISESKNVAWKIILEKSERIRLFAVDNLDIKNPLFVARLKLDLCNNVFSNGVWGSFRSLLIPGLKKRKVELARLESYFGRFEWFEGCHDERRSCRVKSILVTKEVKVRLKLGKEFWMGFSGIDVDGRELLGLAGSKVVENSVGLNKYFTWRKPESWSFDEAATVAAPYLTAYYALYIRNNLSKSKQILIVADDVAAISGIRVILESKPSKVILVHFSSSKVYEMSSKFLSEYSRKLSINRNKNKQTWIYENAKEFDIIMNYSDDFWAFDYLAKNGSFLQMKKTARTKLPTVVNKFFMEIKLEDLNISNEDEETFTKLSELMKRGLENETIVPLPMETLKESIEEIQEEDFILNAEKFLAHPQIYFDENKSYLIIGDVFMLYIILWMIQKNAKKFVYVPTQRVTGLHSYLLNKIISKGCKVVIFKNEDSGFNLEAILKAAQDLSPLGTILTTKVLENLQTHLRRLNLTLDDYVCFYNITSVEKFQIITQATISKSIGLGSIEAFPETFHPSTVPQTMSSVLAVLNEFFRREETMLSAYVAADVASMPCEESVRDDFGSRIQKMVAKLMEIKNFENFGENVTLSDLGIDSLITANVLQCLSEDFGVELSTEELRVMTFPMLGRIVDGDGEELYDL